MQRTPLETDEHGFMTLPLPRPSTWERLPLPSWLRPVPHWHGHKREQRYLLFVGAGILGLVIWGMVVNFLVPSSLAFSFAKPTCAFNPLPLPNLTQHQPGGGFETKSHPTISLLGYPLFSHKTCVTPHSAPTPGDSASLKLAPLANPLFKKSITVKVGELPKAEVQAPLENGVSIGIPLEFSLSQPDEVFDYSITANEQASPCLAAGTTLACPLEPLGLDQGAAYDFKLERIFDGQTTDTVVENSLTTLDPVVLASSSIAPESTAYDKPGSMSLTFNKPLVSAENVRLKQVEPAGEDLATEFQIDGTKLDVSFGVELARETTFELTIDQLIAEDGSQLASDPLTLRFRTSGGPQVANVSVGSTKVNPGASIVLTFDSNLAPGQNLPGLISFSGGNASITANGNKITVNPSADMPRCTDFSVTVSPGLVNEHGVGNGKSYKLNSRTICQQVFSIGRSVQGRSITAYKFGTGPNKIVFVGGMHGNEKSSVRTLQAWVDYLEVHAREIPGHRSIIVIPNHNPDAYNSSRRTNANNVDLNRNFPSNDWSSSVQMPGNQTLPQGGGVSPLDQPESSALASYISSENPRLVLTYHAVARVVISNDAGDSVGLAQKYASDSGYPFTSNANSHGTFEYATTGEFEDWLADKEGIPGILVELSSMSNNQLGTHRSAMWNLVTMP